MRQPQRARTRPRQNRPLRRACSGTIRRPPGCMDRPILTCHWRPRQPAHARIKRGQDGGSIKPPDRGHRRQKSPRQTGSAARATCTGPQVRLQRLHQKALPSAHIFHIFRDPPGQPATCGRYRKRRVASDASKPSTVSRHVAAKAAISGWSNSASESDSHK